MGGACSTNRIGEIHTWFWWGNLMERDNLEDKDVEERIIFKWIFRKCYGGHWIDVA
jgi:hypothetical protein